MRTTLTIDDDVAVQLERLRREQQLSMRDIVNQALREGLQALQEPAASKPFVTQTVELGPPLASNLDDVHEALATAEGDDYR